MKTRIKTSKVLLIMFFIFLGVFQSKAQVTFRPGVRGGANFSHFTKGNDYYGSYNSSNASSNSVDYTAKTDFYLGFYGALKLSKFYTLQPEIDYSAQGSTYKSSNKNSVLNVDYLSLGVVNKFTFGDKFNIHLGPTLDFVVNKNFNVNADIDLAFVLGAGINLTRNFAIEARVKKGLIPVVDSGDSHTNVVFSLGGTYTFDLK